MLGSLMVYCLMSTPSTRQSKSDVLLSSVDRLVDRELSNVDTLVLEKFFFFFGIQILRARKGNVSA